MGLFSSAKGMWDDVRGKTGQRAAQEAAQMQSAAHNQVGEMYQPLADWGMGHMDQLGTDATAGGYGGSLGSIMQGEGFGQLIAERQRAADAQLSQAGLRRSGAAASAAAAIPADMAMQIEREMHSRRMGNMQMGMQGMGNVAGSVLGAAGANASGALGAAQARQQGTGNILNLAGQIGGAVAGMPGIGGMMSGGIGSIFGGGAGSPGTNQSDYTGQAMQNWIQGR